MSEEELPDCGEYYDCEYCNPIEEPMSEFKVEVIRVGPIEKHPNADSLGITKVFDYPVIIKLGDVTENSKAVYIPVDAVCPKTPVFDFLKGHQRIKARKLRGVFSMGLLMPITAWPDKNELFDAGSVGTEVAGLLGITKYEEPPDPAITGGDCEKDPGILPTYTDIQNARKYGRQIPDEAMVVLTEKIHGTNSRVTYDGQQDRLVVGSHHTIKKESSDSLWWRMVKKYNLLEKLKQYPMHAFYFETYGWVQDLRYGHNKNEQSIAFFDVFDKGSGKYLDYPDALHILKTLGLPTVPELFLGPWSEAKEFLTTFKDSQVSPGQIAEGVVIKPIVETWNPEVGRLVLKYLTESYLLRKNGTEAH